MLSLHFSNHYEHLQAGLVARLAARRGDPFAPDELIVPSAAVRRALTLALADAQGVATNLRFGYLAQWLWQQIGRVVPGVPEASPFDPATLTWRVHAALGDAAWVGAQPRLAAYLREADAVMRHALAARIAQLFEQYVTYRPDGLALWQAQSSGAIAGRAGSGSGLTQPWPADHPDAAWQASLWRRLVDELALGDGPSPAERFVAALDAASDAQLAAWGLPSQLHVVAPVAVPPLHLRLLERLARRIDVDVHVLNPCREYWFELVDRRRLSHLRAHGRAEGHEVGHRLLAGWGRQAQALIDTLVDIGGDAVEDEAAFVEPDDATLLGWLQRSILDLAEPRAASFTPRAHEGKSDRSLELHVCHSLTRELEVLQDRLLGLFAADPTLRPSDVLVALPDLEAAAPLVDAVFGTAPPERRLPYAITGRAARHAAAPARAFVALLELVASRMTARDVHGLLQQPIVARRCGLDDEALQRIHEWMLDADLRWGLDAPHRAALGLPADARHTLREGLGRLFLGHLLPEGAAEPFGTLLPCGDAEGSEALWLGAFWRYAEALGRLQAAVAAPRVPAQWVALLAGAVDDFLAVGHGGIGGGDADEREELQALHATIATLADDMARGGAGETPLPFAVVRAALLERLDEGGRGGVPTGAITFASMAALRGLPFRVVAVLGLNDGEFPGAARAAEFDLMAAAPRRGDRQRRHDERNLFLDLLLAAREHLHLSHTGRSVRDNAPLPPSVLVAELLDLLVPATAAVAAPQPADPQALAEALAAARRRLVVEHPLQPFSIEAFDAGGDPRRRSHHREFAEALRASLAAEGEIAAAAAQQLRELTGAGAGAGAGAGLYPAATGADDGDATAAPGADEPALDASGGLAAAGEAATAIAAAARHGHTAANAAAGTPASPRPERDAGYDRFDDDVAPPGPTPPFIRADQPLPPPGPEWRQVELDRLVEFFRNPSRALLRRRLGIELGREADELQDEEPFLAGREAQRALAARLLPPLLEGRLDNPGEAEQLARAVSEWPAGPIGERQLAVELAALRGFAARVRERSVGEVLAPHAVQIEVDLDGEAWQLRGAFTGLRAEGRLCWRYDDLRAGDVLRAWIGHLALCLQPPPGSAAQTAWVARDETFELTPRADARERLAELLRLYRRGLREPLPFFPRAAWAYVSTASWSKAEAAFWPRPPLKPHGEWLDPAYQLVFRDAVDPLAGEFTALAQAVFAPVRAGDVSGRAAALGAARAAEGDQP